MSAEHERIHRHVDSGASFKLTSKDLVHRETNGSELEDWAIVGRRVGEVVGRCDNDVFTE